MKKRNRKKRLILFLILFILIAALVVMAFVRMHPVIMKYAVSVAETAMIDAANQSVIEILEENNVSYSDIVNLSTDADGYITSLEVDIYGINNLKSKLSTRISQNIDAEQFLELSIPLGTFFNDDFLNGIGPLINFKMQLTGTAFVDFKHTFDSAGINQVLHLVTINIDMQGSLVTAGYKKPVSVSTSAIAAQTIIVGAVPDSFTNVIESLDDNTADLINDYGNTN